MDASEIPLVLKHISKDLLSEITHSSTIVEIPAETEILREGQYVKVIPVVIEGLIRVYSKHEDKELLLYYIKTNESCVMSFASSLRNEPSKVYAITEENTKVLLLPADKIPYWTKQFPDINSIFYQQYNQRYTELLDTIGHLLFDKMDKRVFDFLTEKTSLTGHNPLKISHRQIANELGTAREVVSRIVKKLETEGLLVQHSNSIEIL